MVVWYGVVVMWYGVVVMWCGSGGSVVVVWCGVVNSDDCTLIYNFIKFE